ncbi:MAG: ATPase [Clostridia bacterium]|nr:ATPase [Clostridia bacterium]
MAVTKMSLVSVVGSMSKLDTVLDTCCSGENFHIEQATSFFHNSSDFTSINDENPYSPLYTGLKDTLAGARLEPISTDESAPLMPDAQIAEFVEEFSNTMRAASEERTNIETELARVEREMEQMKHFEGLELKLDEVFACEYIKVRFGRLPRESYDKLSLYSDNPFVILFPCTKDSKYVWGVYCAPIEAVAEVDRIFQSLYWERLMIPDAVGTPEEACEALRQKREELIARKEEASRRIESYWEVKSGDCSRILSYLEKRSSRFELRRSVARYKEGGTFFLAGWIPKREEKSFRAKLERIGDLDIDIEKPDKDSEHSPPVEIRNKGMFKPFEFYVKMYGLPAYREIDPTPFVAWTYFILFGMMFADVGQGLVLSIIGYFIMWKKLNMELGRIVGICGISSAIFGVLLGSVFGFEEWLNPFWGWVSSKTGIPLNHGKLINVEDSEVVNYLIYATIGIGAVLVSIAMLLNIYTKLKQGMYGDALFGQNGVAGLVFYVSVIAGAVGMLTGLYSVMTTPYIICLIVVPLLLIFLREPLGELIEGKEHWLPEKPGEFLMQNFFELFEVLLSYVSNTVSFLRVGAFILVHYGMMTVVFTLAEMSPEWSFGYIAVVIIGNGIVIALEGLLVGIQALRLEFYEMFSRFYSGSGRAFTPSGARLPAHN